MPLTSATETETSRRPLEPGIQTRQRPLAQPHDTRGTTLSDFSASIPTHNSTHHYHFSSQLKTHTHCDSDVERSRKQVAVRDGRILTQTLKVNGALSRQFQHAIHGQQATTARWTS